MKVRRGWVPSYPVRINSSGRRIRSGCRGLVLASCFLGLSSAATGQGVTAETEGVGVAVADTDVVVADRGQVEEVVLAAGPDGYTAVWTEYLDEGACCRTGVFAAGLDTAGMSAPRFETAQPLRIDEPGFFDERILPSVSVAGNGTSQVVWHDIGDRNTYLRRLSATGALLGDPLVVNQPTENWQTEPAVAADFDGSFWVAWATSDVGDDGVPWPPFAFGRRFDPKGRPLGPQFLLNGDEPANGVTDAVDLAIGTGGEVAVVFRSDLDLGFFLRLFSPDGKPRGPATRLLEPQALQYRSGASVCPQPGGRFLTLMIDDTEGLLTRAVSASGEIGPKNVLPTVEGPFSLQPRLACNPFGGAVVAWRDYRTSLQLPVGATSAVALLEVDAAGRPRGEVSLVEATVRGAVRIVDFDIALGAGGRGLLLVAERRVSDILPLPPPDTQLRARAFSISRSRIPSMQDLRLSDNRFNARVLWREPGYGDGSGLATARSLTDDTGAFWFFQPDNLELAGKLLDGRPINGSFWFFYSGLTTLSHAIELHDRIDGSSRVYWNQGGQLNSLADTTAFRSLTAGAEKNSPDPIEVSQAPSTCGGQSLTPEVLCLSDRYLIEVDWLAPLRPSGATAGRGYASEIAGDSGAFWFFHQDNLELLIKVLDGTAVNGKVWVFWASLTDLEFELRVTDGKTGEVREYLHEPGRLSGWFDLDAF